MLTRESYQGTAGGAVTFDGHVFTITYSHPALKGLDLRCVWFGDNTAYGDPSPDVSIDEAAWFKGFDPNDPAVQAKWPVRLVCNRGYDRENDYAGIYRPLTKPRSCFFTRDQWAHYKTLNIIRTSYRRWGKPTAWAYGTMTYNMGFRLKIEVKLYGLRPCNGYRIYTRVQTYRRNGKRLGRVIKPQPCPTHNAAGRPL